MPKCTGLEYIAGVREHCVPSCSSKKPSLLRKFQKEFGIENVRDGRNGWIYISAVQSKFLVIFDDGTCVDIARFVKNEWGSLTAGRRAALEATMPEYIDLDEERKIPDDVLVAWVNAAEEYDSPKEKKARAKLAAK